MSAVHQIHWMDSIKSDNSPAELPSAATTSIGRHDIEVDKKCTMDQAVAKIRAKYGRASQKASDTAFVTSVIEEHEKIRKRVSAEASPLVTSYFCSLASIAGLDSNDGGVFMFRHIPNVLIAKWDVKHLAKYFFIVRAAWDDNPEWILAAEKLLMKNLCYKYEDDFASTL